MIRVVSEEGKTKIREFGGLLLGGGRVGNLKMIPVHIITFESKKKIRK